MSQSPAEFASRIQHRCQVWFEFNPTEKPPTGLFIELTLVEAHLVMDDIPDLSANKATRQKKQKRNDRIARIEELLNQHPKLLEQVRSDLTLLWEYYKPTH